MNLQKKDWEASKRNELIGLLSEHYFCFEEVNIAHPVFGTPLRVDIVAIPKAAEFSNRAFAFEVKVPSFSWEHKDWVSTLKQASDYVWARYRIRRTVPSMAGG